MFKFNSYRIAAAVCLSAVLAAAVIGCKELPGTPGQQGAVIGGAGGAAAGAAIAGHNRLLGALLGGALGAGGGYLIGAHSDRITGHDTAGAQTAARNAQANPATPQQALNARTADLNGDGFVTMDEVAAMKKAGLSDQQILERMRATGQVFELTPQQQAYLRENGLDQYVIDQIPQINRDTYNRLVGQQGGAVISQPAGTPAGSPPPTSPAITPVPPPPGP